MEILAIIQARMSSTRLPGKVLLPLEDKTVLEQVVLRVKKAKMVGEVIVATTTEKEDNEIVKLSKKNNFKVFRGSLDDVLDRYYQAASLYKPRHIVRITSDCPLIDPVIIDQTIKTHLQEKADYTASQFYGEKLPDGEDVEVFSFEALEKSWQEAKKASEREHVGLFINNNPKKFKRTGIRIKQDLSDKRWTLDEPEDYEFIKIIFKNLYPENHFFGMREILKFLEKNPEIERINAHIGRNEGLQKSLREDRIVR